MKELDAKDTPTSKKEKLSDHTKQVLDALLGDIQALKREIKAKHSVGKESTGEKNCVLVLL